MIQDTAGSSELGVRSSEEHIPHSVSRIPHSAFGRRAQASLEMTVALLGALLLMLGSFKIFLWVTERLVSRQQSYEATRPTLGGVRNYQEPSKRLQIFNQ
jgi:hypothetical protein